MDEKQLPPDIRDKIYRPQAGESYNVEVEFETPSSKGFSNRSESVNVELDATE